MHVDLTFCSAATHAARRHCAAITAAMLALPSGLAALGQDPALSDMVRTYILALLPSVWLEAVTRWVCGHWEGEMGARVGISLCRHGVLL